MSSSWLLSVISQLHTKLVVLPPTPTPSSVLSVGYPSMTSRSLRHSPKGISLFCLCLLWFLRARRARRALPEPSTANCTQELCQGLRHTIHAAFLPFIFWPCQANHNRSNVQSLPWYVTLLASSFTSYSFSFTTRNYQDAFLQHMGSKQDLVPKPRASKAPWNACRCMFSFLVCIYPISTDSVQFIVPNSCSKLPMDIGTPAGSSLTADQWLLSTLYGPIMVSLHLPYMPVQ